MAIAKIGRRDGRILNVAIGDLGNGVTSYSYFNMTDSDTSKFSLHFVITATTITLEATNDVDTLDASAVWVDVTNTFFGVASETVTGTWIMDDYCPFRRLRVKRLTTAVNNALALHLNRAQ